MIKEYIFKILKEQYVKVSATNTEDAYEIAEETSYNNTEDEEIIEVSLIDVYEEDVDARYDDYKIDMYEEMEGDNYDEERIDNYFYGR